jgi:3-isopropylmalate/(R)-2-methylmalate dehydratase small subunit
MNHFPPFASRIAPLLVNDVDTDQIIPARFLKVTDKTGLGGYLFADWRFHPDGSPKVEFVLNQSKHRGAAILLAGNNFGCGSSREHAPWALVGFGFRAIISTSFADIFRNNALKNALLPITVDASVHRKLSELVLNEPAAELNVDLETQTVQLPDGGSVRFPIDAFTKSCLLNGTDELGHLFRFEKQIEEYEKTRFGSGV